MVVVPLLIVVVVPVVVVVCIVVLLASLRFSSDLGALLAECEKLLCVALALSSRRRRRSRLNKFSQPSTQPASQPAKPLSHSRLNLEKKSTILNPPAAAAKTCKLNWQKLQFTVDANRF